MGNFIFLRSIGKNCFRKKILLVILEKFGPEKYWYQYLRYLVPEKVSLAVLFFSRSREGVFSKLSNNRKSHAPSSKPVFRVSRAFSVVEQVLQVYLCFTTCALAHQIKMETGVKPKMGIGELVKILFHQNLIPQLERPPL